MNISEVMTRSVVSCGPEADLTTAAMLMWNHNCGSVAIVDPGGRAIGIITDRDICMAVALQRKNPEDITVRAVISGKLISCRPDHDIKSALRTMSAEKIRRLPVVNGDGALEGMLSIDDVVASAQRGRRNIQSPELSYDDAIITLKAVCINH